MEQFTNLVFSVESAAPWWLKKSSESGWDSSGAWDRLMNGWFSWGFHRNFTGISWDFMGFYGYYPMNFMEFDGTKGLMNGDLIGLGARPCVTSSCRSVWRRRRRPVGPGWMGKKGLELADVWCGANSCAIPNMTYPLVMCGICMEYIYIYIYNIWNTWIYPLVMSK